MSRIQKIEEFITEIKKQGNEFYSVEWVKAAMKYFDVTEETAKKYIEQAIDLNLLENNKLKLRIKED